MNDQDLESLLSELKRDTRPLKERLSAYQQEEPPVPEESAEDHPVPEGTPEEPAVPEESHAEELPVTEETPQESPAPEASPVKEALRVLLETREEVEGSAVPDKKRKHMRTRDALVGLFLTVFAVIGVIASVRGIAAMLRSQHRQSSEEEAVLRRVLPLVLMDIPEYDSPDALSDEAFLTAAIWETVTSGRLADYPAHFEMHTVPAQDIVNAGNALFGSSRTPELKTIGFTGDLRFYYDAEQNAYLLPEDPVVFTYIPVLRSLTARAEGGFEVQVDYRPETPAWKGETGWEPVKCMVFTVQPSGESLTVTGAALSA